MEVRQGGAIERQSTGRGTWSANGPEQLLMRWVPVTEEEGMYGRGNN
jgi:hypothetical protein